MNNHQEQTTLTTNNGQGYRPRLIEFYGYDGEDFRHFQEILESFLAINNITNESRKLAILRTQLRRAAKTYLEREIMVENPEITYTEAMDTLRNYYITPELIQNYESEFSEMRQGNQEHPKILLARLREAADLTNINSEETSQSRFCAGLLKEIKQFCIQSSSRNYQDWINHADGWWNANCPRKITMMDNSFIPRNVNHALIYNDKISHPYNNVYYPDHHAESIDNDEHQIQYLPVANINQTPRRNSYLTSSNEHR